MPWQQMLSTSRFIQDGAVENVEDTADGLSTRRRRFKSLSSNPYESGQQSDLKIDSKQDSSFCSYCTNFSLDWRCSSGFRFVCREARFDTHPFIKNPAKSMETNFVQVFSTASPILPRAASMPAATISPKNARDIVRLSNVVQWWLWAIPP